jgi:hypothetical protein
MTDDSPAPAVTMPEPVVINGFVECPNATPEAVEAVRAAALRDTPRSVEGLPHTAAASVSALKPNGNGHHSNGHAHVDDQMEALRHSADGILVDMHKVDAIINEALRKKVA